jgi:hypothetical protein
VALGGRHGAAGLAGGLLVVASFAIHGAAIAEGDLAPTWQPVLFIAGMAIAATVAVDALADQPRPRTD